MVSTLTILIIENNRVIQGRLSELLHEMDDVESILTADDFKKARKVLSINKVDIILLCIHVSDADILELVSICNYDQQSSIIILSNHPQNFYKEKYKYLGLNYWIDKANDFDLIPRLIEQITKDTTKQLGSRL
jgi:response regulator of citrate/malate metabolism